MSESLTEQVSPIAEIVLVPGQQLKLGQALENVHRNGLAIYRFEDPDSLQTPLEVLIDMAPNIKASEEEDLPKIAVLSNVDITAFWQGIAGKNTGFVAKNGSVNFYEPDMGFRKHIDTAQGDNVPHEGVGPEESLSFLYVYAGGKDILFYLDGEDNPPTTFRQQPGQLYVFQSRTYDFGKVVDYGDTLRTFAPALWHEVPVQDAYSTTVVWELARAGEPHTTLID